MKALLINFLFLLTVHVASAHTVPGYIVTTANDTVFSQIKGVSSVGPFRHAKKVIVIDSLGSEKEYLPAQLLAFSYTWKEQKYIYRAKPVKSGEMRFIKLIEGGPVSNLYAYIATTNNGSGTSFQELYTFELKDEYCFLDTFQPLTQFKSKLQEFYKNFPEAVKYISGSFKKMRDIRSDLQAVIEKVNPL